MNEQANLGQILEKLHARIARLEIAALALAKSMSDNGALPSSFGDQYKQDLLEFTESLQNTPAALPLKELGDQWSPVFDALSKQPA